jgi:hypothetical protein
VPVRPHPLPGHALLDVYTRDGGYTDCFVTDLPRVVTHAQYVEAFYTTWVFKLERFILKWAVARPSTDEDARRLAAGTLEAFAAWSVEGRSANQLLLCDMFGRTRSWLMVEPQGGGTRLYFGSAVVPVRDRNTGQPTLGRSFSALLGFHTLYSRILLGAAARSLARFQA